MPRKKPPPKICCGTRKDGTPCTAYALQGKRYCRRHRHYEAKVGMAHHAFKSGKYSKYLPKQIAGHYETARADKDLLSLREDIAVLEARIADLQLRLQSRESGAAWKSLQLEFREFQAAIRAGNQQAMATHLNTMERIMNDANNEYAAWDDIRTTMALKEKLTASERKRLLELQQYITVERSMVLVTALTDAVRRNVSDNLALKAIAEEFGRILNNNKTVCTEIDDHYATVTPYMLEP